MSDSLQAFLAEVENAEDRSRSPFWAPTNQTPTIAGVIEEYISTQTKYGTLNGVVVKLLARAVVRDDKNSDQRPAEAGEYVAIWIRTKSLTGQWERTQPQIGETVGVKYQGEGRNENGTYQMYTVKVMGRTAATPVVTEEVEYSSYDDPEHDPDDVGSYSADEPSLPF